MARDDTAHSNDSASYHHRKLGDGEMSTDDRRRAETLKSALESGKTEELRELLPRDAKLLAAPLGYYRDTPFARACLRHNEPWLRYLLTLGAPALAADTQDSTPYDMMLRNKRPHADMMEQFTRLVLLPALILEAQNMPESIRPSFITPEHLQKDSDKDFHYYNLSTPLYHLKYSADRVFFPPPTAKPADYRGKHFDAIIDDPFVRQFMRPFRLTRTWDSHLTAIPARLLPYRPVYYWEPLLQKDFTTREGYRITCLTDSHALRDEGEALDHCVGKSTYDRLCCGGERHILSVRDAHGDPVSTLEVMYYPEATRYKDDREVAGTGYRMVVIQHHGRYNGSPPREAVQAADEFFAMLHDPQRAPNYLTESPTWLGEIVSKRQTQAPSEIEEYIGYTPTWDHVEKIFNEYRRPTRRASIGYTPDNRLIYDDAIAPDDPQKFERPQHFIAGYVLVDKHGEGVGDMVLDCDQLHPKKDQKIVNLRELGLRDWLKATGLMRSIHHVLADQVELDGRRHEHTLETSQDKDRARLLGVLRRPSAETKTIAQQLAEAMPQRAAFIDRVPDRKMSGERVPAPSPKPRRRELRTAYEQSGEKEKPPYFGR